VLTNAMLPSFEGFYFIGGRQPNHYIVTTLLYIEVAFIMANASLFWLILRERAPSQVTPEQAFALARELREKDAG
jgi:hypothetical protein